MENNLRDDKGVRILKSAGKSFCTLHFMQWCSSVEERRAPGA